MTRGILLFLLNLIVLANSLKILGLFPHPAVSHVDIFYPVLKGLALKGHEVTFVSHYQYKDQIPTLKQLTISDPNANLVGAVDMSYLEGHKTKMYLINALLAYWALDSCTYLETPVAQELINSDEHFDVVVMEFFNSDCFAPFAYKFRAPLIGLSSCTMMHWTNQRFGNIYNPSYIPANLLDYNDRMTFFERVENTLMTVIGDVIFNYFVRANDEKMARKYFGEDFPSVTEIVNNASAVLVNAHFSLNLPRPLVPQIIDIGGIHIREVKKLPEVFKGLKGSHPGRTTHWRSSGSTLDPYRYTVYLISYI